MPKTLKDRIIRHIEMSGPLPLAEYMHWCMADSKDGYYQSQNAIGRVGDFITAPEVSQMFGELIGICTIHAWKKVGCPNKFNLVELGPGRGTLMKDLLRTASIEPAFLNAADVVLIETSELLREVQVETLKKYENIQWQNSINQLPDIPSIFIANEFLDVLPIRQFVKTGDIWRENCVGLDNSRELSWVLGNGLLDEINLAEGHREEREGAVFEISVTRETFVHNIAELIQRNSGAAFLIDYGHLKSGFGDTFQAIKEHSYISTLAEPGASDLTSHVDFEALVKVASENDVNVQPLMSQGEFLLELGLLERAGKLGSGKDHVTQQRLKAEAERLALPDEMGNLFKVFAFSSIKHLWPFSKEA